MQFQFFAATLVLMAISVQKGSALKCFACTSLASDSLCGDPFGEGPTIPTCDLTLGEEPVCVKATISLPLDGDTTLTTTTRSCHLKSANQCKILQDTIGSTGGTIDHCSSCTTELCNAGPKSVAVSVSSLLLVLGASLKHLVFA